WKFRSRSSIFHAASSAAACVLGALALFALLAILKRTSVHRSLIGLFGSTAFLGLLLSRLTAKAFLIHYTQKGYDRHYVVIGGTHPEAQALAEYLEGLQGSVFQVRGFLSEDPAGGGGTAGRWPVLGTFGELPSIASRMPVDEAYLLPTSGPAEAHLDLIRRCE